MTITVNKFEERLSPLEGNSFCNESEEEGSRLLCSPPENVKQQTQVLKILMHQAHRPGFQCGSVAVQWHFKL